jgi:hypothetical protein
MNFRVLTDLRHEEKEWHQAAADIFLFPARKLLDGKRVMCVKRHPDDRYDDSMLFRVPNHLKKEHILLKIIEKTSLVVLAVLLSPLMVVGMIVKAIGVDREKELFARFESTEQKLKNNFDHSEERALSEDSVYSQVFRSLENQLNYIS